MEGKSIAGLTDYAFEMLGYDKEKILKAVENCVMAMGELTIADYTTIHGFGTQFRTTTFFQCEDKQIRVSCGCFLGTIPEFREQVKNTREGKIVEEYLMIADLMEKHFVKEKESGE